MAFDKSHIQGNVVFQFYKNDALWYKNEKGLIFPVPIGDIGNATFNATDRAMLFMRYIREHLELIEKTKFAKSIQLTNKENKRLKEGAKQ